MLNVGTCLVFALRLGWRGEAGPGSAAGRWRWLRNVFADGGYTGSKLKGAIQKIGTITMEMVKRTYTNPKASRFCRAPRSGAHIRMAGALPQNDQGLKESIASEEAWNILRPHSSAHTQARKSLISKTFFLIRALRSGALVEKLTLHPSQSLSPSLRDEDGFAERHACCPGIHVKNLVFL